MDTRELLTFVTVSETGNYQRAAELLQYAPSTLFKHVQHLENELGAPLFLHENRTLVLTREGEAFLPHAKAMLSEYQASVERKTPKIMSLTVGGCEMNITNSLVDLFTDFAKCHPNIHINMITSPNAAVPDMIRSCQADIGFYYGHHRQHRELETVPLFREPAFLIASSASPLTRQHHLHYEDLSGMEFVYPHDSCCFVRMLMPELESRQIQMNKITYLGGMNLVVNELRNHQVLSLAPEHALPHFEEVFNLLPLDMDEEPLFAWENILIGRQAETYPVRELLEFSCRWAENNPSSFERLENQSEESML